MQAVNVMMMSWCKIDVIIVLPEVVAEVHEDEEEEEAVRLCRPGAHAVFCVT